LKYPQKTPAHSPVDGFLTSSGSTVTLHSIDGNGTPTVLKPGDKKGRLEKYNWPSVKIYVRRGIYVYEA
jgi:hypothetical protein